MEERQLPMLGAIDGGPPRAVPPQYVKACKTYRQAVRLAKEVSPSAKHMTREVLGQLAGLIPQHVGDYLNPDDKPGRRNLPADAVARYEQVVGNRLVSQWLAAQSSLPIDWQELATRAAA